VNELAHLRCEDVDLKARCLIVRQGKGGNDRIALLDGRQQPPLKHISAAEKLARSFVNPIPTYTRCRAVAFRVTAMVFGVALA
jgi:integrase